MYKIMYCPTSIKVTSVCVHNLLVICKYHGKPTNGSGYSYCIHCEVAMYALKSWNMVLSPLTTSTAYLILDVLHSH